MIKIKYPRTTFDALGRNSFTQQHGIAVSNLSPEVFLEPIGWRGDIGRARLVVPFTHVAALRDALIAILAEPATVTLIGPDPATSALQVALTAIMDHDKSLNDPDGDGSGNNAQSPTGDDYNALCGLLQPLYEVMGIAGPLT